MSIDEKLPDGWVETTIETIADINPGVDIFSLPESTLVSFVPMAAVEANTGRMDSSDIRRLDEVRRGYTAFQENDIIFAKITPCMENGKLAIVQGLSSGIGFGSTEFHVLRLEKEINPHLLYYYLSQEAFRQDARGSMTGTAGQLRVPATFLKGAFYPLAPMNEQSRIVAVIEQQFTRLDSAVASLRSAQARVKQYRASLLKSAVEGELTKEWRAENPVEETGEQLLKRILVERRARWEEAELAKMREKGITPRDNTWKQKYKEPQGPDVESLSVLPESWCWVTVEQLSDERRAVTYGVIKLGDPVSGGIPILRSSNVRHLRFDLENLKSIAPNIANEYGRTFLQGDEILVTVRGTLGGVAVVPSDFAGYNISREVAMIAFVWPSIATCLAFFIGSPTIQNWIMQNTKGIAYTGINIEALKSMPVPFPPFAEQEQIVADVEARLSNIAKLEETTKNNLKRAENERQSILHEAFTGRLVPQDSEDEPASVLLERIQEERKKKEELERHDRIGRKRIKVNVIKKQLNKQASDSQTKVDLSGTLAGKPLSPDDLFRQVGLQADEQPESVEAFYEELHAEVEAGLIKEIRPDDAHVLLEISDLYVDDMASMVESEPAPPLQEEEVEPVAVQPGQAEQSKKTQHSPTLWD